MIKFALFILILSYPTKRCFSEDLYTYEKVCDHIKCNRSCEALSDTFCEFLWSDEINGNISFSKNEKIQLGNTKNDMISHMQKIDLDSLITAKCNLPIELKRVLKINCNNKNTKPNLIDKISSHITENKQFNSLHQREIWKWKLDDYLKTFNRAIILAANKRTLIRFPSLKNSQWNEIKTQEKIEYMNDLFDIKNEVLDAKYLNHPNYKNVEQIFINVKKDIVSVIDSLNIKETIKTYMKRKVNNVKLSLPYEDPRKVGVQTECSIDLKNAFYIPSKNVFTVCAGYFNGFQVTGHLHRAIAHELSHSIDPQQIAQDRFRNSPLSRLMADLYSSNASLDCNQWKKNANEIIKMPESIVKSPKNIKKLNQCLVNREDLKELTLEALETPTELVTLKKIHNYAGIKLFSRLAQSKITIKGKRLGNEFYLNPQLLEASLNKNMPEQYYSRGYFHVGAVFAQNYRCFLRDFYKLNINAEKKSTLESFEKAINETQRMFKAYKMTLFSYVGQNDKYLQFHDLAQPADEEWAEWIAGKVLEVRLNSLQNENEKQIFAISTQAKFCNENESEKFSNAKLQIEKSFSRNAHPLKRNRRLSYFNKTFSEVLDCNRTATITKLVDNCNLPEPNTDINQQVISIENKEDSNLSTN